MVPQRKRRSKERNTRKDVIKVDVVATNWHNRALMEFSEKADNLFKTVKDGGQVLNVMLGWHNKTAASSA
jgi:hypothetical protein